jgi:hypothetical protein
MGDRRSPKPFGRITQDTRVILARFFDPICGDDHPCISRSACLRSLGEPLPWSHCVAAYPLTGGGQRAAGTGELTRSSGLRGGGSPGAACDGRPHIRGPGITRWPVPLTSGSRLCPKASGRTRRSSLAVGTPLAGAGPRWAHAGVAAEGCRVWRGDQWRDRGGLWAPARHRCQRHDESV